MAQLKDTIITGDASITGTLYPAKIQGNTLWIPTSSGGTTYGAGTNGQVLKTNGTTVYWATDSNSDTKVTQTATTTSTNYEVLFSETADNTTRTEGARKNNNLLFNPSTGNLQATQLNGVAIGSSPKFTDNNTTYTLSGALSSHKFTSTLTAGGSGSGISTSDLTLAAGTGITLTDDTSNRKITIACSVTNTDEKLKVAEATSGTTYNIIMGSGTSANTRQYDSTGLLYTATTGTTSAEGTSSLAIGNATSTGTAGNKTGQITLYNDKGYAVKLKPASGTTAVTITIPDTTGTVALTSQIPTSAASHATGISIANHGTGTVIGVQSSTTTASKVTLGSAISVPNVTAKGSGSFSATVSNHILSFSHTHTAPTLGNAISIPNVTAATDVTVPIKNSSASTFVTGTTHTITDNGHTHTLS